jgi:hypothetical protein
MAVTLVIEGSMKAVDRAFAVVTGTRNLARHVLIRQELLAKFLERGCQGKNFLR